MELTDEQLRSYDELGYVFVAAYFSSKDIARMKGELSTVLTEDSPRRILENDGKTVRSVYGLHKSNEVFNRLSRHPKLLIPTIQLLESSVYIYQFKINIKSAFSGDIWDWHQDYIYWLKEDNMVAPRIVNVAIWLDEL